MATRTSEMGFRGSLSARVVRAPRASLAWRLKTFFGHRQLRGWLAYHLARPLARFFGFFVAVGRLQIVHVRADGSRMNYGHVYNLVTTAFVNFMVDQLQTETSVWGDFKYHDSGVGTTGAAVGDTDIETTDGESRATGTQAENAANIYESVGTIAYTTTKAITEHGLFNAATGPTLMDRHTFSAINVVNGDSIEFTYRLTCTAGG